jgi:hypothetical protein
VTTYPDKVRRQERAEARKRRRRFATPAIVTFRMAELFKYFNWLYGAAPLPDDDAGRDDIKLMFQVLSTASSPGYRMFDVAGTWAPWYPPDELIALVDDVVTHPRRFKADTVAARLGITAEIRARLKLRTIGAIDQPAEERAEARRLRKLLDKQQRQAAGARRRAEYETQSIEQQQPWNALRVSRRTWYRRNRTGQRKQLRPPSGGRVSGGTVPI